MINRFSTIFCVFITIFGLNLVASAQEVSIPDPNLATALRKAFSLPPEEPITQQLMLELTKLTAQRAQINNLTGLEYATNLTNLNLNSNQISDISALSKLTQLEVLSIVSNPITDIGPLASLTKLRTLWFRSNQIQDISPITQLTQLVNLFLEFNQIQDISPLKRLTQLERLSLLSNQIRDIGPLAGLTQLQVLSIASNQVSDISPLARLTNLSELYLNDNTISDLSSVSRLTELRSLWLGSNQISSVLSLKVLPDLEALDISDNPISDNIFQIHQLIASGISVYFETSVPNESQIVLTRVIFNEIRNASDDKNDWVELRNVSNTDIPLNEWEISILTREGETVQSEIDVVSFPDYTLPAGRILLITNTDPNETSLLRGHNIRTPNVRKGAQHDYLVANTLKLPNIPYLLILRSLRDKNGTQEASEDVAGTYFFDGSTTNQPLTQGTASDRIKIEEVGYFVEAWSESGYQAGVGYQPRASKDTSPGTPGYPNDTLVSKNVIGQISISEVMFTNQVRNRSVPQWIELYNNSKIDVVNLNGWQMTIETRHGKQNQYSTIRLKELQVMPNQTVLLVTRTGSSSSNNIPERRVYSLYTHHLADLAQLRSNELLSQNGFFLSVSTPDGFLIDTFGNLDGDSETQDTPLWELPSGTTDSGARSSIMRLYDRATRIPLIGRDVSSWRLAVDAKLGKSTHWGDATDVGSPGYTLGGVLPVTLSSFYAERTDTGIVLKWTTESEIDNAGFNILRSETRNGTFKIVNSTLIQGAGTTGERNTYMWTDTAVKPNMVYYYRLEDVSFAGVQEQLATVRMRGHVSAKGKWLQTWGDLKTQ